MKYLLCLLMFCAGLVFSTGSCVLLGGTCGATGGTCCNGLDCKEGTCVSQQS